MVFKLVIVEDEDNIRHSLECFIPWAEMGFQVVGAFGDGTDALEYLRDNPCDVVLTDILMRRMSGLEMIQHLHEVCPLLKIVILSGHSDFGYAQQAIRYQVAHYLVKPVDEDELISVFQGLKKQLDSEAEEHTQSETENREMKHMLQRNFFRDLLSGNISSQQELDEYLKLLGMEDAQKAAGLVAFELKAESWDPAEQEPTRVAPEDILEKQLGSDETIQSICFGGKANQWQIVFLGTDRTNNEALRQNGGEIFQKTVDILNEQFTGGFSGRLTHNVLHLADLLTNAKGQDVSEAQLGEIEIPVSDYKLLTVELDLGCEKTLSHMLDKLVCDMDGISLEDMQQRLKHIYAAVTLHYKKRKIDIREITNGRFSSDHLIHTAGRQDLITCLQYDFSVLCRCLKNSGHKIEHNIIDRIVRYLTEHPDEEISHDAIAAKYRIHPGYLSRLFKQEMGETLSEYLLRIKIERAAQLLKEDKYKIGEIARMVGYSTSSYFSVMFKKYTGCSPREYCQRVSL